MLGIWCVAFSRGASGSVDNLTRCWSSSLFKSLPLFKLPQNARGRTWLRPCNCLIFRLWCTWISDLLLTEWPLCRHTGLLQDFFLEICVLCRYETARKYVEFVEIRAKHVTCTKNMSVCIFPYTCLWKRPLTEQNMVLRFVDCCFLQNKCHSVALSLETGMSERKSQRCWFSACWDCPSIA